MRLRWFPCVTLWLIISASPVRAQGHDHSGGHAGTAADAAITSLIESIRAATARFHDPDVAARAGYRRVGVDFPAMGEHWINPGLLIRREMDYDNPPVLTYARVNGEPKLTGVVFAVLLGPGESPPLVAGRDRPWHEHNGSLTDEILVQRTRSQRTDERRLAVLHLWTEVHNPAGPFATDNWALPFVRLGFVVSDPVSPEAARALALVASGERYFHEVVQGVGGVEVMTAARPLIADARARVLAVIEQSPHGRLLDNATVAALESIWREMAVRIAGVCPRCTDELTHR